MEDKGRNSKFRATIIERVQQHHIPTIIDRIKHFKRTLKHVEKRKNEKLASLDQSWRDCAVTAFDLHNWETRYYEITGKLYEENTDD